MHMRFVVYFVMRCFYDMFLKVKSIVMGKLLRMLGGLVVNLPSINVSNWQLGLLFFCITSSVFFLF